MDKLKKIADKLYDASNNFYQIEPISNTYKDLTIDDAYKIQLINHKKELEKGKKITGKKIGLTSKGMQDAIGVDQPDFGILFDDMEVKDNIIDTSKILQPKVEGELVFVLKEDIGKNITYERIIEATDYVAPAIEIVASRIENWAVTIIDTIADNASCGQYIVSDIKIDPRKTDLKKIEMTVYKNGEFINKGFATEVQGDPVNAVVWLAKTLGKYGVEFNKGDVILSGAITGAVAAEKGDKFICDYGEFGKIEIEFD
ncbi:2-keto-4-pentenoate hydratase [Miniphocaeibacter halophilus]|uniref:Fumarylacetoacetate hydrolase family protein n=1 Tax=Miniphocaeibacter halophilus TaxID=2931922 RepID=A0AC61N0B6_9FIRM|nr:fumarylacetoacetate hydrolase family protein [Miniphocaeibacter halophilus]QQK07598.1 fumarylacetoacetate hydrolase family protein [Miniphocaeibacter halophilus]